MRNVKDKIDLHYQDCYTTGKSGELGKVRKFGIWLKSQGISTLYPKFWKIQGIWQKFKA